MSIVALAVSVMTFAFPMVLERMTHWVIAERYVEYLMGRNPRAPFAAQGLAADDSHAAEFAYTIGMAWTALTESGFNGLRVGPGTVEGGRGEYRACWPAVDVFPEQCFTFANFEFSDEGRIERFTVDEIPVEMLYKPGDGETRINYEVDPNNVYSAGEIWDPVWDPESSVKIVLLSIDRFDTAEDMTIRLESVVAMDGDGEEVTVHGAHFPSTVGVRAPYLAVVRVADPAVSLEVCWSGLPDDVEECDVIYGI